MKGLSKKVLIVYAGAFLLLSFVFTTSECKTARSRMPQSSSKVTTADTSTGNVFYSLAKSLATEAVSQFQETARRNPRLGFNITMFLPNNITNTNATGSPIPGFLSPITELGIVGLKGAILGLKAAVIQTIVLVVLLIFLLSGIAYFVCNAGIISCAGVGGSLTNLGDGDAYGGTSLGGLNPFSRAGYDYHNNLHRATSTIYNAIDDGQKKYT